MRPRLQLGQIRPQISTMPRQQTEAAAYLDIYKLVNEKKRLQQELSTFDDRRARLQARLIAIEAEITGLETTAHTLRDRDDAPTANLPKRPASEPQQSNHNTLFLEY